MSPGEREAQGDEEVKEEKKAGDRLDGLPGTSRVSGAARAVKGMMGIRFSFRCPCSGVSGAGRRRDDGLGKGFFLFFTSGIRVDTDRPDQASGTL